MVGPGQGYVAGGKVLGMDPIEEDGFIARCEQAAPGLLFKSILFFFALWALIVGLAIALGYM